VTAPAPIRIVPRDDGRFVELRLACPPRNVLDGDALDALGAAAVALRGPDHRRARAILLCADGPSFSVGASVPEHGRAQVAGMLSRFHTAIRALADVDLPIVAALCGHCLGGGLELVLLAARVYARPDAKLGQPEIRLGAIAPVASLLLPGRVGQAAAEDLLTSGRTIDAPAAQRLGLVTELADDPEAAASAWIRESLTPLSASSIRFATRAARTGLRRALGTPLAELERLYTDELSPTHDAEEGVRAFLAKRAPRWEDR